MQFNLLLWHYWFIKLTVFVFLLCHDPEIIHSWIQVDYHLLTLGCDLNCEVNAENIPLFAKFQDAIQLVHISGSLSWLTRVGCYSFALLKHHCAALHHSTWLDFVYLPFNSPRFRLPHWQIMGTWKIMTVFSSVWYSSSNSSPRWGWNFMMYLTLSLISTHSRSSASFKTSLPITCMPPSTWDAIFPFIRLYVFLHLEVSCLPFRIQLNSYLLLAVSAALMHTLPHSHQFPDPSAIIIILHFFLSLW